MNFFNNSNVPQLSHTSLNLDTKKNVKYFYALQRKSSPFPLSSHDVKKRRNEIFIKLNKSRKKERKYIYFKCIVTFRALSIPGIVMYTRQFDINWKLPRVRPLFDVISYIV